MSSHGFRRLRESVTDSGGIHGLRCFCGLSWILGFYVARGSFEANSFRGVTVPTVSVATYCFRSLTY